VSDKHAHRVSHRRAVDVARFSSVKNGTDSRPWLSIFILAMSSQSNYREKNMMTRRQS